MAGLTLNRRNQENLITPTLWGSSPFSWDYVAPQNLPRQCGPSSEPSKQSWSPLQSLLMWMQSSVPRQLCSLGWQRDTLLWGPAGHQKAQGSAQGTVTPPGANTFLVPRPWHRQVHGGPL